MPESQIELIDSRTGEVFPAAPDSNVLVSSNSLGWQSITVEYHHLPPLSIPEHQIKGHRLAVNIGAPVRYEWWADGKWQKTLLQPGEFCLQSDGDTNFPRWWDDFEFIAIAIDPAFISQSFQGSNPAKLEFRDERGTFDDAIATLTQRFKAELSEGSYCGKLYGESLGITFVRHLLESYSTHPTKLKLPKGQLSSQQMKQTIEYVHDNLGTDLDLTDLAQQANLSAFHFSRLFKKSLGLTPHQYVLHNRVERAKKLLSSAKPATLADVGLQAGFYDQAHFSKAFKRVVGLTPKQFTRQMHY
ncbi:MAG: AraC family transcriptional regulator [Cyanobacteria bacterium P01_D01_bin.1]